jgi:hypothetical protein
LDRLTHHAHILELVGESFRFRQRLKQDQAGASTTTTVSWTALCASGWVRFRLSSGSVFA